MTEVPIQAGQVWESRAAPGYRLRVVRPLDDGRWLAERVGLPPASPSGLQLGETTPVSERQLRAGSFDLTDDDDPYRAYRERAAADSAPAAGAALDPRFEQARRETIPALRAEAGLPPEDQDDEGGYEEERERYLELLEATVVGKQMAILMLKERKR